MATFAEVEALRRAEDGRKAPRTNRDGEEPPEWNQMRQHEVQEFQVNGSFTYQRCGGGRRVIRKHIGGS